MNRFILKHGYAVTFVILAILAWVVYRRFAAGGSELIGFVLTIVVFWALAAVLFLYFWPRMTYSAFKRAILRYGVGAGPLPVNTLAAAPGVSSAAAPDAGLLGTGTSDLLYVGGWLELSRGPLVLHVPESSGRYYSVQFTDPADGANFAYVGTRATGTHAGDYLVAGPGWSGPAPDGLPRISAPHNAVLVFGRVLVKGAADLPAARGLAQQIRVTPPGGAKPDR